MHRPRVLVVGSANMDLVTRVARCPGPGETLVGGGFATLPGGKGANQAVAAARMGARAAFAGRVGGDAFGAALRDGLAAEGVSLDALRVDPQSPTGVATILVTDGGENHIVVAPGANAAWTLSEADALEAAVAEADVVLAQLEIPAWVVMRAFAFARARGVRTVLDIGSDQPVPEGLPALADVVSPNETEAARMVDAPLDTPGAALEAARRLRAMGAARVLLKLGARGALWLDGDGPREARAFPIAPVDSTAAGDAFTAAFSVTWGTMPLDAALRLATAAGALACLKPGAQPAMPARAAVARLAESGAAQQ